MTRIVHISTPDPARWVVYLWIACGYGLAGFATWWVW